MRTPGQRARAHGVCVTAPRRASWIVRAETESLSDERAKYWADTVDQLIGTSPPVHRSRHAATYHWTGDGGVFFKLYWRPRRLAIIKSCFRGSMARCAARASAHLAAAGFRVPRVLAFGEERRLLPARQGWVATAALRGEPIGTRLADSVSALGPTLERRRYRMLVSEKRAVLKALGREVARLHEAGFVAGDLVPPNVWVAGCGDSPEIVLLDHDRTRWHRYGPYWWRARRNLVQLNRIVLAGVSLTDRLRVFRAYADGRRWTDAKAKRRLPWIVAKTAERRRRCDKVVLPRGKPVDFRALMRAGGPYDPERRAETAGRDEGPLLPRMATEERPR